jgi:16S rRNA (uracil1498-N3)-methyltransferase
MTNLFYIPQITGDSLILPEDESRHIIRVLRMNQGDEIMLTDGQGGMYRAIITGIKPKGCELRITSREFEYGKREYSLSIAIAPTKNIDRFEWFLEKSTEIGIDNIYPVICSRSERKTIKPDRLIRVITSAMKQSLKAYQPALHPLISLDELMNIDLKGKKYIAHCGEGDRQLLKNAASPGEQSLVVIGPEGDFTPEEINLATLKGFLQVSLGDSRLRTETAGIAACHTFALLNQ